MKTACYRSANKKSSCFRLGSALNIEVAGDQGLTVPVLARSIKLGKGSAGGNWCRAGRGGVFGHAVFGGGVEFDEVEHDAVQRAKILGSVSAAGAVVILPEGGVQYPVALILYAPIQPDEYAELRSVGPQATDVIAGFPPKRRIIQAGGLSLNPHHAGHFLPFATQCGFNPLEFGGGLDDPPGDAPVGFGHASVAAPSGTGSRVELAVGEVKLVGDLLVQVALVALEREDVVAAFIHDLVGDVCGRHRLQAVMSGPSDGSDFGKQGDIRCLGGQSLILQPW